MMQELARLHCMKQNTLQDRTNQQTSYIARLMFTYSINSTQNK